MTVEQSVISVMGGTIGGHNGCGGKRRWGGWDGGGYDGWKGWQLVRMDRGIGCEGWIDLD